MARFRYLALIYVSTLALTVTSCKQDNSEVIARLDTMIEKLDKIGKAAPPPARNVPNRPQARRPDPSTVYSVPITGSPYEGPKDAKVTIVKAFEFACPFCLRVKPTLEQLQKDYGDDIKIVYKNYVVHPQTATIPAHAACAAQKQGKYKEMYDIIWEKGFKANRNLSADNMEKLAKELKLDAAKFKSDMNGPECKRMVKADQSQLSAVGTRGTPAFYINGRFLSGARPVDSFKSIIDEELKKANEALKKGSKLETYYSEIVKKGKRSL